MESHTLALKCFHLGLTDISICSPLARISHMVYQSKETGKCSLLVALEETEDKKQGYHGGVPLVH